MSKQSFIHGTVLLIISGMITRFLGFINRILIARFIGEEGVGLYMMALPSLFLLITLTQIGLPIAIAKRVAEAQAENNALKIKQLLLFSFLIITWTTIFFTTLMYFFAPILASKFLTDERTLYPLLAICPIVPIIAISSVIKGYFQGLQNMKPQSVALIIEQVVRIIAIIFIFTFFKSDNLVLLATMTMLTILCGELLSFAYLFYQFKQSKTIFVRDFFRRVNFEKRRETSQSLFVIALPNTGSKLISSISNFFEPIIVTQSLAIAGVSVALSTKLYGELTGYALPLLFLPTFITHSLSIALVPSISELNAKNERKAIQNRLSQAIRISFASGGVATIILFLYANPILTYMYGTSNAAKYVILMAPFFLLLYIQAPLQASLFGLDLANYVIRNSLIGAAIKLVCLYLLTSNESFGIFGVVIAINVSIVLITLLHLQVLFQKINFMIDLRTLGKMGFLLLLTYVIGSMFKTYFYNYFPSIFSLLIIVVALTIVYILISLAIKLITYDELSQIPLIRRFL